MISSCNGRNEVNPKYCLSSGSRFVVPDFTAVKVNQASRLSRKLASGAVVGRSCCSAIRYWGGAAAPPYQINERALPQKL
jgi:hypothetical protein